MSRPERVLPEIVSENQICRDFVRLVKTVKEVGRSEENECWIQACLEIFCFRKHPFTNDRGLWRPHLSSIKVWLEILRC